MAAVLFAAAWHRHRKLRWSVAAGLFAFQLLLAGVYEALPSSIFAIAAEGVPSIFKAMAGGSVNLFTPAGWLGFGYTHPLALVLVVAWTAAVADAAVAREVEDGTLELLASRPVDRRVILAARIAAWAAGLVVILAAGAAGTLLGTVLVDDLAAFDRLDVVLLVGALLPVLAVLAGAAFLASAVASTRARSNGVAVGFAVVSYLLNFAALLWEPLKPYAPLSVFHYLRPSEWVESGTAWGSAAALVVVGVGLMAAAHFVLQRRDIAP